MDSFKQFLGIGQSKKGTESREALNESYDDRHYQEPQATEKKHKGKRKIWKKVKQPIQQCLPYSQLAKGSKKRDRQSAGNSCNRVTTLAVSGQDDEVSPYDSGCISSDDDDTQQPSRQGTTVAQVEHNGGIQTTPKRKPSLAAAHSEDSSAQRIQDQSFQTQGDVEPRISYDQTPGNADLVDRSNGSQMSLAVTVREDKYYIHQDSESFLKAETQSLTLTFSPTTPPYMAEVHQNDCSRNELTETAKIRKHGLDSWIDRSGSLFEEIVESTKYTIGSVIKITRYGRNTWRTDDSCLFQRLPMPGNETKPRKSVQRSSSHEEFIEPNASTVMAPNDDSPDEVNRKTPGNDIDYQEINISVNRKPLMNKAVPQIEKGMIPSNVSSSSNIIDSHVESESIAGKANTDLVRPIKQLMGVPASPHQNQPVQSDHHDTSNEENGDGSVMRIADDRTDIDRESHDLPQVETVVEFGNLMKADATTNFPTDLEDLIDDVAKICETESSIKTPSYLQHRTNPHSILLQGPNMRLVEDKIQELVKDKYPQYSKTVVSEKEPEYITEEGLPVYTRDLVNSQKPPPRIPYYLQIKRRTGLNQSLVDTHKNHSTCGVFFRAEALPYPKAGGDMYTMTSYHALFFEQEGKKLATGDDQQAYDVLKKLAGNFAIELVATLKPHNYKELPLKGFPLGNFRYFIPQDQNVLKYDKFMADEVFLRASRSQLLLRGWTGECLQSHVNFTPVGGVNPVSKPIPIRGILPIKEPRDIGQLINVRVWCAGSCGTICPHPTTIKTKDPIGNPGSHHATETTKFMIAHHIAFTLEGPRLGGNSGAPVYVYDEEKTCMYIVGILKGSWQYDDSFGDEEIYQAIPLYPAIERTELKFNNHIRGIRLECSDDVENSLLKDVVPSLVKTDVDTGYFGSMQPPSIKSRSALPFESAPSRMNHQSLVDGEPSRGDNHINPSHSHQASAPTTSQQPFTPPLNITPLEGPPSGRPSTLPTQITLSAQGTLAPNGTRSLPAGSRSKSNGPVPRSVKALPK